MCYPERALRISEITASGMAVSWPGHLFPARGAVWLFQRGGLAPARLASGIFAAAVVVFPRGDVGYIFTISIASITSVFFVSLARHRCGRAYNSAMETAGPLSLYLREIELSLAGACGHVGGVASCESLRHTKPLVESVRTIFVHTTQMRKNLR